MSLESAMEELKVMQVGGFKELSELLNPSELELLYIPSLEAVLRKIERDKGSSLTAAEIKHYTDNCTVVAVDEASKKAVLAKAENVL
jgi:hypothetical protein